MSNKKEDKIIRIVEVSKEEDKIIRKAIEDAKTDKWYTLEEVRKILGIKR